MRRLTTSAESCVFDKQSLGPLHCGRHQLGGQAPPPAAAPLLPKLRGSFAEFLNHSSPDRLGMFYPPTCVGLRYGPRAASLGVFLGSMGSLTSPSRFVSHLSPRGRRVSQPPGLRGLTGTSRTPLSYPSPSPHCSNIASEVQEYQPAVHRLRLPASP